MLCNVYYYIYILHQTEYGTEKESLCLLSVCEKEREGWKNEKYKQFLKIYT